MTGTTDTDFITVLCFGPLAEEYGRVTKLPIETPKTCTQIIEILALTHWADNGLKVALNGEFCDFSSQVRPGDELALLPPVSGG